MVMQEEYAVALSDKTKAEQAVGQWSYFNHLNLDG
eukprot:SAG31_NODE_1740_length_7394_cov_7.518849_2_plen_35_part_00